jgi:predicted RNase H-like nuclease
MSFCVLGIDGCKIAVGRDLTRSPWPGAYLAPTVSEVVGLAEQDGAVDSVAVDIPIGLPDSGRRRADIEARQAVGARWNSVFMTPVRKAVEADTFEEALALNRALAGEGVSQQAYGLRAKLLEVDDSCVRMCDQRSRCTRRSPSPPSIGRHCQPPSERGPACSGVETCLSERGSALSMTLGR